MERERNSVKEETRLLRQSLRYEEHHLASISLPHNKSGSTRTEHAKSMMFISTAKEEAETTECSFCHQLKRKLKKAKADNKEVLALNQSLMENLNDLQTSYQSHKEKHEAMLNKMNAIYDFLTVFEGQGPRTQSRLCGRLVEQLKQFVNGEVDALTCGDFARTRSGSEMFVDLASYDMSNFIKTKTKIEELRQELNGLGRLITEVRDKEAKEYSFDLSNKSSDAPEKPRDEKKKKYFQKIWDIKS